jgi:hypothetical protein
VRLKRRTSQQRHPDYEEFQEERVLYFGKWLIGLWPGGTTGEGLVAAAGRNHDQAYVSVGISLEPTIPDPTRPPNGIHMGATLVIGRLIENGDKEDARRILQEHVGSPLTERLQ